MISLARGALRVFRGEKTCFTTSFARMASFLVQNETIITYSACVAIAACFAIGRTCGASLIE
jgi:hypothetical protein